MCARSADAMDHRGVYPETEGYGETMGGVCGGDPGRKEKEFCGCAGGERAVT